MSFYFSLVLFLLLPPNNFVGGSNSDSLFAKTTHINASNAITLYKTEVFILLTTDNNKLKEEERKKERRVILYHSV